jgi:hypothetical protein
MRAQSQHSRPPADLALRTVVTFIRDLRYSTWQEDAIKMLLVVADYLCQHGLYEMRAQLRNRTELLVKQPTVARIDIELYKHLNRTAVNN